MQKLKITSEQYNRLFKNNLNENFGNDVEPLSEDIFSNEFHEAISNFIKNIWANPSQKGLDKIFVENGITWGDIITYLTSIGVITAIGSGLFRINNYFKRKFSSNEKQAMIEKLAEIDKVVKKIEKDPAAPWSKNRLKSQSSEPNEVAEDNAPMGSNNDSNAPWNQRQTEPQQIDTSGGLELITMNNEVAIFNGVDGIYVFYYFDLISKMGVADSEKLSNYVNNNYENLSKGEGLEAFESGVDLSKLDEPLKNELMSLYSKDKRFISVLNGLNETTGAVSSGAVTGALTQSEELLDETTTTASSGAYVQPQIWAKNKANWKPASKTQYPNGEMVKTKKTNGSVISRDIYEMVAKKTGRTILEVKEIIKTKYKSK